MPEDEMAGGVLDVIAEEVERRLPEPKAEEKQTPAEAETPEPKTKDVEDQKPAEPEASAPSDNKETPAPEGTTQTEATTPEPSQVNSEAETQPEIDWKATLPPEPPKYAGKVPEYNEDGAITNMTAQEYENYLISRADERQSERQYIQTVENRALEAAEQILPQIKTNPEVRRMVEDARIASVFRGQQIDSYEAAKQVRAALGLSDVEQRIVQAKAEGAQNAKTHIEVQKNAAVETKGATQKKEDTSQESKLMRRLKKGESDAMVELMDIWQEKGVV